MLANSSVVGGWQAPLFPPWRASRDETTKWGQRDFSLPNNPRVGQEWEFLPTASATLLSDWRMEPDSLSALSLPPQRVLPLGGAPGRMSGERWMGGAHLPWQPGPQQEMIRARVKTGRGL